MVDSSSSSLYQTVGCRPVASLDHFVPEHLGNAALVEEVPMGASKVVKVSRSWLSHSDPSLLVTMLFSKHLGKEKGKKREGP